MSSLHQTVQRGRVSSHQDGEQKTGGSFGFCSFRRLEFRECGGFKLDWYNLRLQRMSKQGPPIMNESQYCSDNPDSPPKDPLLMALTDMNSKLEGIERLEKSLQKQLQTSQESWT